jgi:hypothetical protein
MTWSYDMDNPTEAEAQATVIRWRDMMVATNKEPRLALLHGDASGVRVGIGAAKKMKRQGAVKGFPDLFLPIAMATHDSMMWGYHGLFVELKRRKGGTVSPEQREIHRLLREQGYRVEVCRGSDEAIRCIKEYLGI